MNNFLKDFERVSIEVIEPLTGENTTLNIVEERELSIISNILPPIILIDFSIKYNDKESKLLIAVPNLLSMNLTSSFFGEEMILEETSSSIIDEDILNGIKEIYTNIFGTLNNENQKNSNNIIFEINNIRYIEDNEITLEDFDKMFVYNIEIKKIKHFFMLILKNDVFEENIIKKEKILNEKEQFDKLYETELNVFSIINKVDVKINLRIGNKKILLKDIMNLNIGDEINIENYKNNLVDIMIDDKIIAYGELTENNNQYEVKIISINENKDI